MNPSEPAVQRLARSRAQLVQWLDADQTRRDAFSHSGLGQLTTLPWVRRIGNHPLAGLALGAVTKWWMKPRSQPTSATGLLALGTGLGLLRRRPVLTLVTTVAAIGAVTWWTQLRQRPSAPTHVPPTSYPR